MSENLDTVPEEIDPGMEQNIEPKTEKSIFVPTKLLELENDMGFITRSVDDLENYYTFAEINEKLSKKQSVITDLDTIRMGAEKGGRAVQQKDGKDLFSGDYNDLKNPPKIPSRTTHIINDSGYATVYDVERMITVALGEIVDREKRLEAAFNEIAKKNTESGEKTIDAQTLYTAILTGTLLRDE